MGTFRTSSDGHIYLDADDWRAVVQAMHGEDNGSWVLMDNVSFPATGAEECVAILTRPDGIGSLIIFITHLAAVTFPEGSGEGATAEDVRYLADQVKVHQTEEMRHPVYYLPTVHVRREGS